jgi:hypothetical protein
MGEGIAAGRPVVVGLKAADADRRIGGLHDKALEDARSTPCFVDFRDEVWAPNPSFQFFKVRSQKKSVRVHGQLLNSANKRIGPIRALKMRYRREAIKSARARPSAQLFGIRSVERAFLSGRDFCGRPPRTGTVEHFSR